MLRSFVETGRGQGGCYAEIVVDYRSFVLACAIAGSQPSKMLPRFLATAVS